jgi:alpha-L-rhamnosidase
LHTQVPVNTRATLFLPATDRQRIFENGSPLTEVKGVKLVRQESDRATLELESGVYDFRVE